MCIQSDFSGLTIFRTTEICSKHGQFEPLRVENSSRSGGKRGIIDIHIFDLLNNNCMLCVLIRIA